MSSSPEPDTANGYSHIVDDDTGNVHSGDHSEDDMFEMNDTVTARPYTATDLHESAGEDEKPYTEEHDAIASSESDNNNNVSEDADFDMEESPAASHSDAAQDERSASNDSRQSSKRKVATEEEDYIAANPELYGLRRSVRFENFSSRQT